MQEPCRPHLAAAAARRLAAAAHQGLVPVLAIALALGASPGSATSAGPASHGVAPAPASLRDAALAWAAAQAGVAVDTLALAPMDSRIEASICPSGWVFDHPFVGRDTLRARCAEPRNQFFPRLVGQPRPAPSSASVAPMPASAGGPSGGPVMLAAATAGTPAGLAAAAVPSVERQAYTLAPIRDLPRGTQLTPDMVTRVEADPRRLEVRSLREPTELQHVELVRDVRAGQALRATDLRPTKLVRRGQLVTYTVGESMQYRITARLEALQDGVHGERIRLRNPESGRIVSGRVTAENTVAFD